MADTSTTNPIAPATPTSRPRTDRPEDRPWASGSRASTTMSSTTAAPRTTRAGRIVMQPRSPKARAAIPTLDAARPTPASRAALVEYPNAATTPNPVPPAARMPATLATAAVRPTDTRSDTFVSRPAVNRRTTIPTCDRAFVAPFTSTHPSR